MEPNIEPDIAPDTESRIEIIVAIKAVIKSAAKARAKRNIISCTLNPFDLAPLTMAVNMAKECGASVTALTMGPPEVGFILRQAIAMGADRGILVSDPRLAGSDTLATAHVIADTVISKTNGKYLLLGVRSSDSDTGQVGFQTASLLNRAMISGVTRMSFEGEKFTVDRFQDGFEDHFEVTEPCVFTVSSDAESCPDLAFASLNKAFQDDAPIETYDLSHIGLDPTKVGEAYSMTRVNNITRKKSKRICRLLEGSTEEIVEQLTHVLQG